MCIRGNNTIHQLIKCIVPISEYVQNRVQIIKKSRHKNYECRVATVYQNSPSEKVKIKINSAKVKTICCPLKESPEGRVNTLTRVRGLNCQRHRVKHA